MRMTLPLMSLASASALAALLAALRAPYAPLALPARSPAYALPQRVQVALQAAARARR